MRHLSTPHRYLCSELVSVTWIDESGQARNETANLEAIAEGSVSLLAEVPIAIGSKLRISCQNQDLKGTVGSSEIDPMLGYFIEVELEAASRWSEKWFTPQHLLKLWESVEDSRRKSSFAAKA